MQGNPLKHGKTPNSERPAGARNKHLRATRTRKRAEAEARNAAYAKLSPEQKAAKNATWKSSHQ